MTLVQVDKKPDFCLTKTQTKRFSRLQSDYQWIFTHEKQLSKEYPDKYIAVQDTTVRFTADTVEQLMETIHANHEQVENYAIKYLSQHSAGLLF